MDTIKKSMTELKNLASAAVEYLGYGLGILPTSPETKRPVIIEEKHLKATRLTTDQAESVFLGTSLKGIAELSISGPPLGIGIHTGTISGNLEVIDVDAAHDPTGRIWPEFEDLLKNHLEPDLYCSLVIVETKSGGKHIYYRCDKIAGNKKLAEMPDRTTLIETRGEGGYVMAPPTPKYNIIQGSLSSIPTITPETRAMLFGIATSLTRRIEPAKPERTTPSKPQQQTPGLEPYQDYDQRGPVIELLEKHGWVAGTERGERIPLLRPGVTDSKSSGNFHTGLRRLYVFSTSTDFEAEQPYSPTAVYAVLECRGDFKLTTRRLAEAGYGDQQYKKQAPTQVEIKTTIVTSVNSITSASTVISVAGETLKIETAEGDTVNISSPGPGSAQEVLALIAMYEPTGKKIYITETGMPDPELKSWGYELHHLINAYNELPEATERALDMLLSEAVKIGSKLKGTEQARFNKMLCLTLDMSPEALAADQKRIADETRKEKTAEALNKATERAQDLLNTGKTVEAAKLLQQAAKEAQANKETAEALVNVDRAGLRDRLINKPPSIHSGYTLEPPGEIPQDILLPAGAITFIAAPSSHGKTRFLLNTALNVSETNGDKKAYFFSYEEEADAILLKAFNIYQGEQVGSDNLITLENYFKGRPTGIEKTLDLDILKCKDREFFESIIDPQRLSIHYTDMNVTELSDTITQLHRTNKISAVFIDYIQLMSLAPGGKKNSSRQEDTKEICQILRELAIDTQLPIIIGAQVNRDVKKHNDLHMTKMGEAGDIERVASLIIGFWNNIKDTSPASDEGYYTNLGIEKNETLYVKILKNRIGRSETVGTIEYNGNTGKMMDQSTALKHWRAQEQQIQPPTKPVKGKPKTETVKIAGTQWTATEYKGPTPEESAVREAEEDAISEARGWRFETNDPENPKITTLDKNGIPYNNPVKHDEQTWDDVINGITPRK